MDTGTRTNGVLAACVLASVALHAGAIVVMGPIVASRARATDALASMLESPPDAVRPGIARSDAMTISWIGFEKPTPHTATPADSDQPELTVKAPPPGGTPVPPSPTEPAPSPEAAAAEVALARESARRLWREIGVRADAGARAIDGIAQELRETVQEAIDPVAALVAALRRPARAPRRATEQVASQPVQAPGVAGEPGRASDRESVATSVQRVELKARQLGDPAAAEGVDIKTVRPKFTHYTRITADPSDPLVRVQFDRTGAVVEAEIIESSGHRDVDRPILDAIYRWKASGKAIDSLKVGAGPATLTLEFRIVL